jgi:hypothetical protein
MAQTSVVPLPKPRPGPPKGVRYGGRQKGTPNKRTPEMVLLARQYGPEVLAKFINLLRKSDDEDIVLRAGQEILNRGFGRPPTAVALTGPQGEPLDFTRLDDGQLQRLLAHLEQFVLGTGEESHPILEGRATEARTIGEGTAGPREPTGGDSREV